MALIPDVSNAPASLKAQEELLELKGQIRGQDLLIRDVEGGTHGGSFMLRLGTLFRLG